MSAVVATMYIASLGAPLGCGVGTVPADEAWFATPDPSICGDLYYFRFSDGSTLLARALDTGPFANHCVMVNSKCLPIIADIPAQHAPFTGLSIGVEQMYNITAEAEHVH